MGKRLTSWQCQYIIDHINDRPRSKVAKAAGVSISALYACIKAQGGIVDHSLSTPSEERIAIVKEHYPYMSLMEISTSFDIPYTSVARLAKKMGLKHTEDTEKRLKLKHKDTFNRVFNPSSRKAFIAKMKRIRTLERFRIMSGMPQQTKLRVSLLTPKAQVAVTRLCRERNYFRDIEAGGHFTLFYDEQTDRTPFEHLYVARYRICFKSSI